jgi:pSer/pThr/pTyr-binding forkhead associated (FHA) protein
MTLECPQCKSPVAREGQRFCYRCGQELKDYYDSLQFKTDPSKQDVKPSNEIGETAVPTPIPKSTVVLDPNAFDTKLDTPPVTPNKASLKILLPTGDVFDRELNDVETQIGKGPRNDIVVADPAVSTAHALVRFEEGKCTISDLGSRNGTFVNGEPVSSPHPLNHGDVIGMGLSKLTFRLTDYSETGAIQTDQIAAASFPVTPPPLTEASLARAVVDAGLARKSDVDRLRSSKDRRLYRALVEEKLVREEALRDVMSRTFQIPAVDLSTAHFEDSVIAALPAKLAREHQVMPISKEEDAMVLAVADPTDNAAVEQVRTEAGSAVRPRLATASQIHKYIELHYGPKVVGVLPSGDKLEYPIDQREVAIGKAAHNQIVLTDPTVSNTHAIVISREGGYSIADLGSRNGTFVNGERLGSQAHTLKHGDKIQLGKTLLTFRNPGETAANVTAVLSSAALEEVRRRAGAMEAKQQKVPKGSAGASAETAGAPPIVEGGAEKAEKKKVEAAPIAEAEVEKADKKKKKKKKKKEKDDRLRAAYIGAMGRVLAAILSVALTVALTLYLTRSGSNKVEEKISKKGKPKLKIGTPGAGTPIEGGTFEASGVVQVPGAAAVLFVDDKRLDEIVWMPVDQSGKQAGATKPIPLGASIADLEAITYDGHDYFYVTGSQSNPNDGDKNAIARFKFDAGRQAVTNIEVISGLRDFLLANVTELKGEGEKPGKEGGLNIEGLAWDPKHSRLLLGLRSPQMNGNALIVPVAMRNAGGAFAIDNLGIAASTIQLPLEGLGIRDLHYDTRLDSFLIIAGAPEHHEKKLGFKLWQWSGDSTEQDPGLQALTDLDQGMKPEGVARFESGGRDFIFIVGDVGSYTKLEYAESQ